MKETTKSKDQIESASAKINGKLSQSVVGVQSYKHWTNPTNADSSPYALKALLCNWVAGFIFRGAQPPLLLQPDCAQQSQGPFQELRLFSDVFNHRARLQPPTLEKLSANCGPRERLLWEGSASRGADTCCSAPRNEACTHGSLTLTVVGVWIQSIIFPPKVQINANFTHLHFSCCRIS